MSANPTIENAYTDSPRLHRNLLLGTLQIGFWLLVHPSAWRNYIERILPGMRPDFALVDLKRDDWRKPEVRHLLRILWIMTPFLVAAGTIIPTLLVITTQHAPDFFTQPERRGLIFAINQSTIILIQMLFFQWTVGVDLSAILAIANTALYGPLLLITISNIPSTANNIHWVSLGLATTLAGAAARSTHKTTNHHSIGQVLSGAILGIGGGTAIHIVVDRLGVFIFKNSAHSTPKPAIETLWGIGAGFLLGLCMWARSKSWRAATILSFLTIASMILLTKQRATVQNSTIVDGIIIATTKVTAFTAFTLANRIAGTTAGSIAIVATGISSVSTTLNNERGNPELSSAIRFIESYPYLFLIGITLIIATATQRWWRPILFYPFLTLWHLALFHFDETRRTRNPLFFRYHAAFWDELQLLRWSSLDEHLLLALECAPAEGAAAREYLSRSPRQRWAAQEAQIELDARTLERANNSDSIRAAHQYLSSLDLEGPATVQLRSLAEISKDVDAALHQETAYNQRNALARSVERLNALLRDLTRAGDRYSARFRPIAVLWHRILTSLLDELGQRAEALQELDNPYVPMVPLTENVPGFVERREALAQIHSLLLDRRCPPLLLYGQRRMGKTSLLQNLNHLLPSTLVPLFVDMQGPVASSPDSAALLYNLARKWTSVAEASRRIVFPPLTREALAREPFTVFDEWLDEVEKALAGRTALLIFDEFEKLADVLARPGHDEQAVLGLLRNLIQHRERFKVLLAGSHQLDEMKRWASELINVQVVPLAYMDENEARKLIEQPVPGFQLRYEPEASRRILDLTRGHPCLIQHTCRQLILAKNRQPPLLRRLATAQDVEAVVPAVLEGGTFFFVDIEEAQVTAAGRTVLRSLAAKGPGASYGTSEIRTLIPDAEQTIALLLRRELLEPVDGRYRFQVELIRRWFAHEARHAMTRDVAGTAG